MSRHFMQTLHRTILSPHPFLPLCPTLWKLMRQAEKKRRQSLQRGLLSSSRNKVMARQPRSRVQGHKGTSGQNDVTLRRLAIPQGHSLQAVQRQETKDDKKMKRQEKHNTRHKTNKHWVTLMTQEARERRRGEERRWSGLAKQKRTEAVKVDG